MTPDEHYAKAEEYLKASYNPSIGIEGQKLGAMWAQVHATLATVTDPYAGNPA